MLVRRILSEAVCRDALPLEVVEKDSEKPRDQNIPSMETRFLAKTYPKWLEIDKSTPNNPAVVLSQKLILSRNIKKFPFIENATVLEKETIFSDVLDAVGKSKIIDSDGFAKINLQQINGLFATMLFEKDIIPWAAVRTDWMRGILTNCNNEKFPMIAVNTKNHIDFSLYFENAKALEALEKLNEIDNILGEELLYAYDSRFGFLFPKPEECGCGLSVEMVAHLPGLVMCGEINQTLNGLSVMGARAAGLFNEGGEAWGAFFRITAGNCCGGNEKEITEKADDIKNALTDVEAKARKRLFKEAKKVMEDKVYRSLGMLKSARILPTAQLFNFISLLRLGCERKLPLPVNIKKLNIMLERGFTTSLLLMSQERESKTDDLDEIRADFFRMLFNG
jgi:protein arginine kinase